MSIYRYITGYVPVIFVLFVVRAQAVPASVDRRTQNLPFHFSQTLLLQAATLISAQSKSLWGERDRGGNQKDDCHACSYTLGHLSLSFFVCLSPCILIKKSWDKKPISYLPSLVLSSGGPCSLMTLTLLLHFFKKFNAAPLIHWQRVPGCDNWSPSSLGMG